MKLFVWNEPYDVAYGQSMVFAVAETVEQARELCRTGTVCTYGTPKDWEPKDWTKKINLGEPTRVVDIPCAEWHEWSE